MKLYEIKGFWGLTHFILLAILVLSLVALVPVMLTLVTWNAVIGDLLEGPMISFWQATLLAGAVLLGAQMIFKPEIELQFQREPDTEDSVRLSKDSDTTSKKH